MSHLGKRPSICWHTLALADALQLFLVVITRVWKRVINVLWNFSIALQSCHAGVLRVQWESLELTSELNELKGGLGRNAGADTVGKQACT